MAAEAEIHILEDSRELAAEAADLFLWLAEQAIAARGRYVVALSGGSTPKSVYSTLASSHAGRLDWSKVFFFFGDERCVPPTHSDSNFQMAQTSLFLPLKVPEVRIFRMKGELEPEIAAHEYEATMRRTLEISAQEWPRYDLVLLGLGPDGHTASLFPGTAALKERDKWVTPGLAPNGVRQRLTITLDVINHADMVLFLVSGTGKARIVREVLEPSSSGVQAYPASLVRPSHGRLLWFLDSEAASELTTSKQHVSWREE
ncbi:MAG TPA: 6-phosphogluconolactonase [Nitrospiraceae bacterium]|nr:6-phosphogluconolactonase [Nitrospiraceae bacterium]